jgi:hypothetical protein
MQRADELVSVHVRHTKVTEDDVDLLVLEHGEGVLSIGCQQHLRSQVFEHRARRITRILDILYHEHAGPSEFVVELCLPCLRVDLFGILSDRWQSYDDFGALFPYSARM